MKKIILGLVSIVLAVSLAGCTSESTSTTEFNVKKKPQMRVQRSITILQRIITVK